MRAGFLNVNSITAHIGQTRQYLVRKSYHLFGVAKTWLERSVDDHLVQVDGYSLICQGRNITDGGVAFFVRNIFKVKVLEKSNTTAPGKPGIPEFLICCVQEGDCLPVLVAVIYRPSRVSFYKDLNLINSLRDI